MKKILGLAVLGLIMSASFAQADTSQWAAVQYSNLSSTEMQLEFSVDNHPMVGMSVEQKNFQDGFCRKYSPVVPNPQTTYACFRALTTGAVAEQTFAGSSVEAENVGFFSNGSPIVGVAYSEKQIQANVGAVICAATYPIVPQPVVSYVCYEEMIPVGGGVSVGN